ncbi:MAG: hypothetical protein KGR26_09435, partial [Cyanobacteria bacterium REEB65]|nr:hypothetical protein [Cyanobacteria bacterium REEB65]
MAPGRRAALAIGAGLLAALAGCLNRPAGVDFSADPDFTFNQVHRVAIMSPLTRSDMTGLSEVLVDAAADALARR